MTKEQTPYAERIICDPRIMAGKPVIKGTRIPVEAVLAHLADNPDIHDLFEAYPRLTPDDVKACLAFAAERVKRTPRRGHALKVRPAQPANL